MFTRLKQKFAAAQARKQATKDLLDAIQNDDLQGVKNIMRAGKVDPNAEVYVKGSPRKIGLMNYAVHFGTPRIVQQMIDSGANINGCNLGLKITSDWMVSPLAQAVFSNKTDTIKLLLQQPGIERPDRTKLWEDSTGFAPCYHGSLIGVTKRWGTEEHATLLRRYVYELDKKEFEPATPGP